jgi:uncharacterized membrane protein YphA (DoxX/SURF4 family)
MQLTNLYVAEALLRIFTGILFFSQGYDKLFRLGMKGVVNTFHAEAESHHVPSFFIWLIVVFSTLAEFVGGFCLIAGLFRNWSLVLLATDLLFVSFAFSFMQPMWDTKHVLKRIVLITLLLLAPVQWAAYSIDYLITKH